MDRCILYTGIRLLLLIRPLFLHFSFSNFQTLNFFVTLFSGTVRPRRLKLGTYVDSGQMYLVHQNQAAAAYSSLFFFSFSSTLKIFVTFFSGTVRSRRLKLGTHVDSGEKIVYIGISCCCLFVPLFRHFSFCPIFKHWNFSSHSSHELWGLEDWN